MRAVQRRAAVFLTWALALLTLIPRVAEAKTRPSLVVLVVVDQLGRYYLDRYTPYLTRGFARLKRGAAFYPNVRYDYANTETAPGHATLSTGAWPSVHGITGNGWYTAGGAERYSFHDPDVRRGPMNLRVPTMADALHLATNGRGKVVSISMKDRAAIALGGRAPELAAWYDKLSGRFIAGSWKGTQAPPAWFNEVALRHLPADAFEKTWDHFDDKVDYAEVVGPDDLPYEESVSGFGRTFPRKMGAGLEGPTSALWKKRFMLAPQSMDGMVDIALTAVNEERLGQDDVPDLLAISFSHLDYAGHYWGSHSQEAFDMLRRIDAQLERVMLAVEASVGGGRVMWVLTADHGATPTVEAAAALGLPAGRLDPKEIQQLVDGVLTKRKSGMRLVDLDTPRVFFSPNDDPVERVAAARAVARALAQHPMIEEAYATADLDQWPPPYGERFRRSHYPGRGGEVAFRIAAHHYPSDLDENGQVVALGSGHGSPYAYDSDVPVFVRGPGVTPGEDPRPYTMTQVAPTIAAALGILPPAASTAPPLPAVTR